MEYSSIPATAQRDAVVVEDLRQGATIKRGRAAMRFEPAGAERAAETFSAALSSDAPIDQWFGREILIHTPEAVNLERAENGLPLLWNHDRNEPIGRCYDLTVEGGRLRAGRIAWSQRARAQEVMQDVKDGMLGEMSIAYTLDEYREEVAPDGAYVVIVDRWTVLEASITPVPADHTVGIGRSRTQGDNPPAPAPVIDISRGFSQATAEGQRAGREAEISRVVAIEELFAGYRSEQAQALRRVCIASGHTEAQAARALLELINAERGFDAGTGSIIDARQTMGGMTATAPDGRVTAGDDARDKFRDGCARALEHRTGLVANTREIRAELARNPYRGMTLYEMARESLRACGLSTDGMDRDQCVRFAIAPWTHPDGRRAFFQGIGISDFVGVLENNANKALTRGWYEADESWPMIVREGTLPDYKAGTRVGLGGLSTLERIYGNGEYRYLTMSDQKEPIQMGKYGGLLQLTREAIINDDQSAFAEIPMMGGKSANRTVGNVVYALLTSNGTMSDGVALFHATHANIGSAGAPTVARLDEGQKLLALQKSPGSPESGGLNTPLRKLILPQALRGTGLVLRSSVNIPNGTSAAASNVPNIWAQNFDVVVDARLDAASATIYYASGDPNSVPVIEVAFLNGNREPFLESREGWTVDGVEYKVRHEFAAAVLDWRGIVRFPG